MSTSARVQPLSMSQTKDELLKALGMTPQTYTLMAKEADTVYKELTMSRQYLKQNCTRSPPYDWSDIESYPKDQAMARLASGGSEETRVYWALGEDYRDPYAPNWVARWFLYHKFRYRDGRNRGKDLKAKKDSANVTPAYKTSTHARKEDTYIIPNFGIQASVESSSTSCSSQSSPSMFYDPVKGYRPRG